MTALPYAEVIGDPIAHSKSPLIHGFWLRALNIDAEYRTAHVRAEDLATYFESRCADDSWRGCNVTVPHKESVIPLLGRLTDLAAEVGAVNTVTRQGNMLMGNNSDVLGILDAVPQASSACLIGSGGAALGALAAFRRMGVRRVDIVVRNQAKGELLLARLPEPMRGRVSAIDDATAFRDADLIVNASILGMAGKDSMPQSLLDGLRNANTGTIVFDMVYHPLDTELLKTARTCGLRGIDGLHMLVGQAAAAFRKFFGASPPRDRDGELRTLLTS